MSSEKLDRLAFPKWKPYSDTVVASRHEFVGDYTYRDIDSFLQLRERHTWSGASTDGAGKPVLASIIQPWRVSQPRRVPNHYMYALSACMTLYLRWHVSRTLHFTNTAFRTSMNTLHACTCNQLQPLRYSYSPVRIPSNLTALISATEQLWQALNTRCLRCNHTPSIHWTLDPELVHDVPSLLFTDAIYSL